MLEKPDIPDSQIAACLREAYGISTAAIQFLPLGADLNTSVYRVDAEGGEAYFLKLRRTFDFNPLIARLPKFLSDQGIRPIIPPLQTASGDLWTGLGEFTALLYPFISGNDGYAISLTEQQWHDFGAAVRQIHSIHLPDELARMIRSDTFQNRWTENVRAWMEFSPRIISGDDISNNLFDFLFGHEKEIFDLIDHNEWLAGRLQSRPVDRVLCHSDLHAGNVLVNSRGELFIVDWDNPILAPKERDLMFIGGGQGFRDILPKEEETLFYHGYGEASLDQDTLDYYRCVRICEDLAIFCDQIFSERGIEADREQAFRWLVSNFLPGGTIEIAMRTT